MTGLIACLSPDSPPAVGLANGRDGRADRARGGAQVEGGDGPVHGGRQVGGEGFGRTRRMAVAVFVCQRQVRRPGHADVVETGADELEYLASPGGRFDPRRVRLDQVPDPVLVSGEAEEPVPLGHRLRPDPCLAKPPDSSCGAQNCSQPPQ
ncbi:hypothetical protein [Actinoplanes sp. NPDC049265]|uniref:hypothetical protein n=1 Tax=Actinoplanes sp. NPDC049265 TaxID=3363902 RepID=UPI003714C025